MKDISRVPSAPLPVQYCGPQTGGALQAIEVLPPTPHEHVRIVCISDTHNEHEGVYVPMGDVLVHAGDILTASGRRHIRESATTPDGVALFERFAAWIGTQQHAHIVVISEP
jgi:hypothetical protein